MKSIVLLKVVKIIILSFGAKSFIVLALLLTAPKYFLEFNFFNKSKGNLCIQNFISLLSFLLINTSCFI
jgi:hypothetical protein